MTYAEIRPFIQSGAIIAFQSRRGLLAWLTRFVTRSSYTHLAVALWLEDNLLVAEMDGTKAVLSPLSQRLSDSFEVFLPPKGGDPSLIKQTILQAIRTHIAYDFLDLVRIGLWRTLRLPLPNQDRRGLVCSALVARIWQTAGLLEAGLSSIPAPDEVILAAGQPVAFRHFPE